MLSFYNSMEIYLNNKKKKYIYILILNKKKV